MRQSAPQAHNGDLRQALTDTQLACLRAARTKLTNKNIAIELGISPNTVAQHLKEARLRLGDVTRAEAVEIVYALDHHNPHPHKTTSATRSIASGRETSIVDSSPELSGVLGQGGVHVVREERTTFDPPRDVSEPNLVWFFRVWMGSFNRELRADQRGKLVIRTALALGVLALVIIAVGESLNRTLRGLGY